MTKNGASAFGKKRNPFHRTRCETNWSLLPGLFAVEKLLPDIPDYSYHYTFQDGTPAHRARETVELPTKETLNFIPPNL